MADGLPAFLDAAQRALGRAYVGHRQERLRLDDEGLLALEVAAVLHVALGVDGITGCEECILGRPESGPQTILILAAAAWSSLPTIHESPVGTRGARPVGRDGKRLSLANEGLLGRQGVLALGIARGEVLATSAIEGRARCTEALPQCLLAASVDARCGLPCLEEGGEAFAGGLPLGRLR